MISHSNLKIVCGSIDLFLFFPFFLFFFFLFSFWLSYKPLVKISLDRSQRSLPFPGSRLVLGFKTI